MNPIPHRLLAVLLLSSVALAACQGYGPISPLLVAEKMLLNGSPGATASAATPAATAANPAASAPVAAAPPATLTAAPVNPVEDGGLKGGVVAAATTADYSPTMPVALAIPAVGLQAQVTPMGWTPVLIDGATTTRWVVPEQTLGWAVNSAGAGEAGNVIIVGHQAIGAALFRPLALGEVTVGQAIQLQAANGKMHLYRVTEVSDPITAIGATAGELAQAAAYLAPGASARLTLVSGWPADATTHRLFVVAEYVGESADQSADESAGVQP
jgi:sortase (surface protein transpeptidase)